MPFKQFVTFQVQTSIFYWYKFYFIMRKKEASVGAVAVHMFEFLPHLSQLTLLSDYFQRKATAANKTLISKKDKITPA